MTKRFVLTFVLAPAWSLLFLTSCIGGFGGPPSGGHIQAYSDLEQMHTFAYNVGFYSRQYIIYDNFTEDSVYVQRVKLMMDVFRDGPNGEGLMCMGSRTAAYNLQRSADHQFTPVTESSGVVYETHWPDSTFEFGGQPINVLIRTADAEPYYQPLPVGTCTTVYEPFGLGWSLTPGWNTSAIPEDDDVWYWEPYDP